MQHNNFSLNLLNHLEKGMVNLFLLLLFSSLIRKSIQAKRLYELMPSLNVAGTQMAESVIEP